MERHLKKFLDQVKRPGVSDWGSVEKIATEYNLIRSQTEATKQKAGLTMEAGALKNNTKKNRYRDILPYDQSRVLLNLLKEEFESDYINASLIQGATKNRLYIATQGPLSNTVIDFWRMIWQYEVKVIIMACKEIEMGKKKCEQYWPPCTKTAIIGPFVISNLNESLPNEEVVVRTFSVKYQDETRGLSQFQYMAWPDHGIPLVSDGLLGMMDMAQKVQASSAAPLVIHCSAGCGRTGVICALDYINDLLKIKRIGEDFNIMDIVLEIRSQRPSAVQTKEQYEFLYHIVSQMFENALKSSSNHYQNMMEPCYDNVRSLKKEERQATSFKSSRLESNSKPIIQPRTSCPKTQNMNDTYAVVNKPKQRPAAGSAPPHPTVHHYDNAQLGLPSSSAGPLYSTVKPKNRASGPPAQPAKPDRARPASSSSEDYEFVSGVFRTPSQNALTVKSSTGPNAVRKPSPSPSSTEDDYEYVETPMISRTASQDGSMGFNYRVKKPRGPRDPPVQWSRAER
ncbi:tyrosine-protein phosphatase non-receptor type 18 [Paramormyrops kingsleyae]|uniref:protein-tyrosine-phosphatase n=1 Tax=Paramormyrops kingsleyae TaxID=1676925 RepID=A0A3B3T4K9_9TELE|nr:tyrosine-protein phosphatase non-receptor type 18-like [Paramormyrops kingsleyae]